MESTVRKSLDEASVVSFGAWAIGGWSSPYPRSTITSEIAGTLDRSSPPRGSRTKMTIELQAGNHVRFAEALWQSRSHAPSVSPFEQEVTSLETAELSFRNGRLYFTEVRHSPLETLSQDFIGYPVATAGSAVRA